MTSHLKVSSMRPEKGIADRELDAACIHEAGQLVMINRLGGVAMAVAWENPIYLPESGLKAWLGQVRMHAQPGTISRPVLGGAQEPTDDLVRNWQVLVGLAGVVSECIRRGNYEWYEIAESLSSGMLCDELSEMDAALIGECWTEDDVETAYCLIKQYWQAVILEAQLLRGKAQQECEPS